MVYIREAHTTDGWQVESNLKSQLEYTQPQTIVERTEIAKACSVGLKISIPVLIDDMENTADFSFNSWPERLYVLGSHGEILYQSGKGPYGFDTEEFDAFLKGYLQAS